MPVRVSRKDKGSFVVKEKCYFSWQKGAKFRWVFSSGHLQMGGFLWKTTWGLTWQDFPREVSLRTPKGWRESLTGQVLAPLPHHLGVRVWDCSWIYKAGLHGEVSGATNPAKPPELLLNYMLPGSLPTHRFWQFFRSRSRPTPDPGVTHPFCQIEKEVLDNGRPLGGEEKVPRAMESPHARCWLTHTHLYDIATPSPHLIKEEAGVQRSNVTCPKSYPVRAEIQIQIYLTWKAFLPPPHQLPGIHNFLL